MEADGVGECAGVLGVCAGEGGRSSSELWQERAERMSNSSSTSLSSSMVDGKEQIIASSTARIRARERRERNRVLTGIVLMWSYGLEDDGDVL